MSKSGIASGMVRRVTNVGFLVLALNGCAGPVADSTSPKKATPVVTSLSVIAGDGQVARKGTGVQIAPVILAKDQFGNPISGVTIIFAANNGGSVAAASAVTGANGTASVGGWTLSTSPGANTLTATAAAGANPSTSVTATSRNPLWTLMVYMAADNNLALSGITNIDQLESAGSNPEVQIVIQAEFSPSALAQAGCSSACFNRPNFNTFRYVVSGGPNVKGPNGPVIDIGNRNMTAPDQLNEFVTFAKQAAPAEHYAIVLWNHGNGYGGLFEDDTSAPGGVEMTLSQLGVAFAGVGLIDVMAFDMCLMGGYETLTKISNATSFAVFSENVVPGLGYPYDQIVRGMQNDPQMNGRTLATLIADRFDTYYAGQRPSTTVSAYDMAGFNSFEAALNTLAVSLRGNLATLSNAITAGSFGTQAFELRPVKDIGNLLDSLGSRISDATISVNIEAVRRASTAFRLQQHARTGADSHALNVGRASGLSIMLPSGVDSDRLPASGYFSLAAYQDVLGSKPWGNFITAWMANKAPLGYTDMGSSRFETYLVWDTAAVSRKADIDLFVLEPSGSLYGPAFGTISPNGLFTADSYGSSQSLEGYQMNRYVETGVYRFYAFLWTDANNYGPAYTIYYRNSPSAAFQSLYAAPFPRLTTASSIGRDTNPTFGKIDNFQYSDFRPVAFLNIAPNVSGNVNLNLQLERESSQSLNAVGVEDDHTAPRLTQAQIAKVRTLMSERAVQRSRRNAVVPQFGPVPIPHAER